jgi:hypothetical protein
VSPPYPVPKPFMRSGPEKIAGEASAAVEVRVAVAESVGKTVQKS